MLFQKKLLQFSFDGKIVEVCHKSKFRDRVIQVKEEFTEAGADFVFDVLILEVGSEVQVLDHLLHASAQPRWRMLVPAVEVKVSPLDK